MPVTDFTTNADEFFADSSTEEKVIGGQSKNEDAVVEDATMSDQGADNVETVDDFFNDIEGEKEEESQLDDKEDGDDDNIEEDKGNVDETTDKSDEAWGGFDFGEEASQEDYLADLGVPETIKSKDDLKGYIDSLKNASTPQDEIGDESLKGYIDSLKEIHKSNGDWRGYKEEVNKLESAKADLDKYSNTIKKLDGLLENPDIRDLRQILINNESKHHGNDKSYMDAFKERLDEKEEFDIKREAYSVIRNHRHNIERQRNEQLDNVTNLQKSVDGAVEVARKATEEAKKQWAKAVESYSDEISPAFDEPVKKLARGMFEGDSVDVKLPAKAVKFLLLGDDGKVDPNKLIGLISKQAYSKAQVDYALSQERVKSFRESSDVKLKKGQDLSVRERKSSSNSSNSVFAGAGSIETIDN